jgi:hypothetical protein
MVTVAVLLGHQRSPAAEHHRAKPADYGAESPAHLVAEGGTPRTLMLAVVLALTIAGLTALGLAAHPADVYLVGSEPPRLALMNVSATHPEPPRLALTAARVHANGEYFATATGFLPGEPVEFSWTGPTNGVMGPATRADQQGRAVHGPIIEKDPRGSYQIIATGLTSRHVATAPLEVLPSRQ